MNRQPTAPKPVCPARDTRSLGPATRPRGPLACWLLLVLIPAWFAGAGCGGPSSAPQAGPSAPLAGTKVRLLVVDDPALAQAAARLRGEWQARSGSELQLQQMSSEQLLASQDLPADAVICPAWMLGPLAERQLVQELPEPLLAGDAARWSEVFDLVRFRVLQWDNRPMAVSFGSPVLVCYCRADLLEALGRQPPQTWQEYAELAALLNDRSRIGPAAPRAEQPWCGCIEPLAPGWAGLVLMARAAAYVKHRNNVSDLFDIDTMEPMIDRPPWVRALEELVAAAQCGVPEQFDYDPAAARRAFWQGRCGMALCWPSAADDTDANGDAQPSQTLGSGQGGQSDAQLRLVITRLPGSPEAFDYGGAAWDQRTADEPWHVPLLSTAGRVGAVARRAQSAQASWRLLLWLSGPQFGAQIGRSSPATTMFRRSHLADPRGWVEPAMGPEDAAAYGRLLEEVLSGRQSMFALRIPGRPEYLAALDEAVRKAVRAEARPAAALREAAQRWQAVTDRLGREAQRRAYLHSLGLVALGG